MTFRLRTFVITVAVLGVLIAVPSFINTVVLPDNRRVASELLRQIGKEFEATGDYPNSRTVKFSDLQEQPDLKLQKTTHGTVANRWGQEISITPAILGEIEGRKTLDLTVTSRGPFGILGVHSSTELFEYDISR